MASEREIHQQIQAGAGDIWQVTPATLATHISRGMWTPAPHLLYVSQIVASAIHAGFVHGIESRIIISIPPRHGKSQLFSVWTPIWVLKHWPWANIMLTSYGSDLASDFSRTTRDTIIEHEEALGINLDPNTRQVTRWMTTQGGGEFAVGVGGPITGRGAHVLLVDDYLKNAKEASSKTVRNAIYEWFTSTALTRLEPGAPAIIVATRWHPDDLSGRLLKEHGDVWKEIKLPALAEENDPLGRKVGEALWPERYSANALMRIRDAVLNYYWSALYKQAPIAARAGMYDADGLEELDIIPDTDQMILLRSWDLAATQTDDIASNPDWTVGTLWGFDYESKRFGILDIVRGRWSPHKVMKKVSEVAEDDGPEVYIRMEQEPGSAGKIVIAMFAKLLWEYLFKGLKSTGPKAVRAQPFLAACENGMVYLKKAAWNRALKDEINAFSGDSGDTDDQIDACSLGYNELKLLRKAKPTWGRKVVKSVGGRKRISGATFGRRRNVQ